MSLTVWDPFHDMEKLLDKYNRTSRKSLAKSDDRALGSVDVLLQAQWYRKAPYARKACVARS